MDSDASSPRRGLCGNRRSLWTLAECRARTAAAAARLTAVVIGVALLGAVVNTAMAAERTGAAPSPKEVRDLLDEASRLLADGKAARAADRVADAAAQIGALAKQDRIPSGLRSLRERCEGLRDDIALEGVDVAQIVLEPLGQPGGKAAGAARGSPAMAGKPAPAAGDAVSFSRQVAPLLARHCGGCHIAGRKGGFQMTSYAGLMNTGVVQPGVGEASRLVEVIMSGDMPRGGGKVSSDEVGLLVRWIDAGAPFDGPEPGLPIDAIARQTAADPAVAAATRSSSPPTAPVKLKAGEVSFASDVAPVLLEHCAGCHGADNPESNFSMATFERLLRGGRGGAPLVAGKAADSLLVKKITGTGIEGQRMPLGKDPLPDDVIATIRAWVDQGIKLDMLGPKEELPVVAAAGRASRLSHAELRPVRFEAGRRLWSRAIPDEQPAVVETGDALLVGNVPEDRLDGIAGRVESVVQRLRKDLTGGDLLVKGGAVVYVFAKPYDFSGFWQIVMADERPKAVTSSAGATGDVVYAALVAPAADADAADVTATLTEQLAAAALLGRGAPAWFARGAGRALAMKAAPKSAVVQSWRRHLPEAVQRMGSAADVMAGRGDQEVLATLWGAFLAAVATGNRTVSVVQQMDQGATFDQAFQQVFRGPPQAVFEAWCGQQARALQK